MTCEFGHHVGARATFPHELGIRTMSEREAECIEQDRFAGSGFAREHVETRTKFNFSHFDQNNVAQSKCAEHEVLWGVLASQGDGGRAVSTGRACHASLPRKVAK